MQYVDARDLAAFALSAAERGAGGPFDVVSPSGHTTMRALLETCAEVTGSDARLCWTDPQVVLDAGIEPWSQLPVWTPPGELHDDPDQRRDRPRVGLDPELEATVLAGPS